MKKEILSFLIITDELTIKRDRNVRVKKNKNRLEEKRKEKENRIRKRIDFNMNHARTVNSKLNLATSLSGKGISRGGG